MVHGDGSGFDYGKTVKTQACKQCGKAVEVAGTSVWWGNGKWKSLGLDGCTQDFPSMLSRESGTSERD